MNRDLDSLPPLPMGFRQLTNPILRGKEMQLVIKIILKM